MQNRSYYIIRNKRPLRQYNNRYKPTVRTKVNTYNKCIISTDSGFAWLYHKENGGFAMHHIKNTPPRHILEKYFVGNYYNAFYTERITIL